MPGTWIQLRSKLSENTTSIAKSTCNYLKAVNKQDKKKFKNMAITGTVNCQWQSCICPVLFANTDKALAMDLEQHQPTESFQVTLRLEVEDIDQVSTYDIACEYFIHLEERFKKNFPHLVGMVKRMRWGVPALHVQGHQDSCTYLFGTAYMECVGHFHGETAEQYWPEANQLGPHVRQMNNGHRQDTMIVHHGDWNHQKNHVPGTICSLTPPAVSLAEYLAEAKTKYIEKRNHFIGLSVSFRDDIERWQAMPRTTIKKGKDAKMLSDETAFASTMIPKSKVARLLDEGLKIQDVQSKLAQLINDTEEHDLVSRRKEITKRTEKTQVRLYNWRKQQNELMPRIADKVAEQAMRALPIQDEKLFLPSDFPSEQERQSLDLISLAVEEAKWREGQAFDHLRALQNVVKALSALRNRKIRDDRKQKENTRAGDNIREAIALRDQHMASYEVARKALISLNATSTFPPLTEPDLYMKSVQQKRRVGDSRHTDGALWRVNAPVPIEDGLDIEDGASAVPEPAKSVQTTSGTQMNRRKSGPRVKSNTQPKLATDERPEGWLWQLGKLSKMSDAEMEEWSKEGDRVQWFRAEAEMQRWQEQGEQKLAELLRTNRSFQRMGQTWLSLASTNPQPGHQAYARQKAAMYQKRAQEVQDLIRSAGYKDLLTEKADIVSRISSEREREAKIVADAIFRG
ncbi:hypothetical protein B0H11DRAFT_1915796 [Mycena galericulata]|nr:hypothetical protein B0H11DRAFT_1915796 [Mycena galericulata]